MPETVLIRVNRTGVEWEVTKAKADELTRWYPGEYDLVAPATVEPTAPAEKSVEPTNGEAAGSTVTPEGETSEPAQTPSEESAPVEPAPAKKKAK